MIRVGDDDQFFEVRDFFFDLGFKDEDWFFFFCFLSVELSIQFSHFLLDWSELIMDFLVFLLEQGLKLIMQFIKLLRRKNLNRFNITLILRFSQVFVWLFTRKNEKFSKLDPQKHFIYHEFHCHVFQVLLASLMVKFNESLWLNFIVTLTQNSNDKIQAKNV